MEGPREECMIKKRLFSVIYMFILTFFFTAVVTGIHKLNRERITINEEIKLQRIILKVLGVQVPRGITALRIRQMFKQRVKVEEREGRTLYRGFTEDRKTLIGYAFPLFGPGFWGPIYGIMAIDPKMESVLGIAFYRHNETPGLGGRITEEWFERQFAGKRLIPREKERKYFSLVPPGMAQADNELDAITGATGTSRGVERLVNESLRDYLPWIAGDNVEGRIEGGLHEG